MKTSKSMGVGVIHGLSRKVNISQKRWLVSLEKKYVLPSWGGIFMLIL